MTQNKLIEAARAIVKKHYPEMPDHYMGRRVQIALEALCTAQAQEPVADDVIDIIDAAVTEGAADDGWTTLDIARRVASALEFNGLSVAASPPAPSTPDAREWFYYPIAMPLTVDGHGPATIGKDAATMTYEVWDQFCNSHGSFSFLPDAINGAMRLNAALPLPTPSAPDAALREALQKCRDQFRLYEHLHAAKGNLDGDAKARTNCEFAEMCEAALSNSGQMEKGA